ncbi:hypothetical protein [Sorangium sp. So ce117]|uniref:hypothetical protein n=1 Tax=Sorangium sp. So ce117 TaxID=3133277 RepID=UPI003F63C9A6
MMRFGCTLLALSAAVAAMGCRVPPRDSSRGPGPQVQASTTRAGQAPAVPSTPDARPQDQASAAGQGDAPAVLPLWQIPTQLSYQGPPLPADVQESIALYQPYLDQYAWQLFIALNWPACPADSKDPDCMPGEPDTRKWIGSGGDGPTVWEQWSNADEVFRPNGAEPLPWGARGIQGTCKNDKTMNMTARGRPLLTMNDSSRSGHNNVLRDALYAQDHNLGFGATGPLIDQNRRWARFEAYINKAAYDYIVSNKLYSKGGQEEFAKSGRKVNFPPNADKRDVSIEIKVVWKILGEKDRKANYHTTEAWFVDKSRNCQSYTVGLVAMHITTKDQRNPARVWATFEHVDNLCREKFVKLENAASSNRYGYAYVDGSFCSAKCRTEPLKPGCVPNRPPSKPWNPPVDPIAPGAQPPTQVVRERPLPLTSIQISSLMATFLSSMSTSSVWKNYELVGTQWVMPIVSNLNNSPSFRPVNPGDRSSAPQYIPRIKGEQRCSEDPLLLGRDPACLGLIIPPILANTLIETYEQTSSSCLGCHAEAKTSANEDADFSFLLERAWRVPPQ